jgi:AcrR family transcriptional regulator
MNESTPTPRRPGRPVDPSRREAIIEPARAVFAAHGYAGSSLDRIARSAEVKKAGILHHFGSKEALYFAVLERVLSELGLIIEEMLKQEGAFDERLDSMAGQLTSYFLRRPDSARILLRDGVNGGPFMSGERLKAVHETYELAKAFLRAGVEAGEFRAHDEDAVLTAAVGNLLFLFGARSASEPLIQLNGSHEEVRQREHARFATLLRELLAP